MKNKLLTVFLCMALLIGVLSSCTEKSDMLKKCGEDVISIMVEMIDNEDYREIYDLSEEYDEEISKLCEGDYSHIEQVYELIIPVEQLMNKSLDEDDVSEDLYQYVCSSALTSFASRINQASGVKAMAVASMFSTQKSFASKKMDESTVYLYVFEDGYPIAVTFADGGEDAFRAIGYFILNEEFDTDDEDSIRKSCKDLGIGGVTVNKK